MGKTLFAKESSRWEELDNVQRGLLSNPMALRLAGRASGIDASSRYKSGMIASVRSGTTLDLVHNLVHQVLVQGSLGRVSQNTRIRHGNSGMKKPEALDTFGSKRRKGGHLGVRVLFLACDNNFDGFEDGQSTRWRCLESNNNEMVNSCLHCQVRNPHHLALEW